MDLTIKNRTKTFKCIYTLNFFINESFFLPICRILTLKKDTIKFTSLILFSSPFVLAEFIELVPCPDFEPFGTLVPVTIELILDKVLKYGKMNYSI